MQQCFLFDEIIDPDLGKAVAISQIQGNCIFETQLANRMENQYTLDAYCAKEFCLFKDPTLP